MLKIVSTIHHRNIAVIDLTAASVWPSVRGESKQQIYVYSKHAREL
jgi:hypothetical protein